MQEYYYISIIMIAAFGVTVDQLPIEQFRNEELEKLQTEQNYEDFPYYFEGMMRFLIREDVL